MVDKTLGTSEGREFVSAVTSRGNSGHQKVLVLDQGPITCRDESTSYVVQLII
jgi:hypothetical protein